jgi:hypothetical protein
MYMFNGTIFLVSDEPHKIPDKRMMTSAGLPIENGQAAEESRLPTDGDMRVISTREAKKLFGTGANIIDGVSVSSLSWQVLHLLAGARYSSS